jgi:HEAT repeat protein
VPALVEALGDGAARCREAAATSLASIAGPATAPVLASLLLTGVPRVKASAAAKALAGLTHKHTEAALQACLASQDPAVRRVAALAFGVSRSPTGTSALESALLDSATEVRQAAAVALEHLSAAETPEGFGAAVAREPVPVQEYLRFLASPAPTDSSLPPSLAEAGNGGSGPDQPAVDELSR